MAEVLPEGSASPISENMFGKMRGRFCEHTARALDRSLKDAALSAIVAMPPDELRAFSSAFNKIFERDGISITEEANG